MKRLAGLLLLVALFLAVGHADAARGIAVNPVSPLGTEVKGDQWLFVIGIDTYLHWPRLKTAVNDARSMRDVLLDRYHFDGKHLIELYNEQATEKNIIRKFRHLAGALSEEDSLLVFYAGHGYLDPITKEGSWIPVESGIQDPSAWISNHDIKNYLKIDAIRAKHILLISDSCFSGDFFRGHRGRLAEVTDALIRKSYTLNSRQAITSGGLEPVSDTGFGGNSVFSYFLLQALKENRNPFLIPSAIFPRIKAGVAENAEQFPQFGTLKDTGGSQGGEMVLFLKGDTRLEDLSTEALSKQRELDHLTNLETQAREAKKREEAEIAAREAELAQLDTRIADMRKRLGSKAVKKDDSLDTMLAMVRDKEAQQRRLEELRKQREAEEAKRKAEIARLKREQQAKLRAALEEDIRKYEEIVASPYGKDMKDAAWARLAAKYPEQTADVAAGDTDAMRFFINRTNSIGMEFVLIPAGTFMMGSPDDETRRDDDERLHKVTLTKPFYLQTTEVTQRQWKALMGNNPSRFKGDDHPVERVSWKDAREFIQKLNGKEGTDRYRLPTEAEWEYACRAGTENPFSTGRCISTDEANYDGNHPMSGCSKGIYREKTMPVGSFSSNQWGLYDMHGNVWEWCGDRYGEYPGNPVIDPTGPSSGTGRVLRGGSWFILARYLRAANRLGDLPDIRGYDIGFRVVRAR